MTNLSFRVGSSEDVAVLFALEHRAHAYPWPEQIFHNLISQSSIEVVVAEDIHKQIVAFAVMQSAADEATLLNIVVSPDFQGRGIGRDLLNHIIDAYVQQGLIKSIFLEVRVSNFSAIRLYMTVGFVEVGERRAYYEAKNGAREDAIIMALPLEVIGN